MDCRHTPPDLEAHVGDRVGPHDVAGLWPAFNIVYLFVYFLAYPGESPFITPNATNIYLRLVTRFKFLSGPEKAPKLRFSDQTKT